MKVLIQVEKPTTIIVTYLKVIARKATQALHVLDRFHVLQHMNKAVDEVRAQEARARALKVQGREAVLTHTCWCLLKRSENLGKTGSEVGGVVAL